MIKAVAVDVAVDVALSENRGIPTNSRLNKIGIHVQKK